MASIGPQAPTGATTTNETPWLDEPWVNPANIYGAGEASVTAGTFDNGDQTGVLKAYGFNFAAIPDGATIRVLMRSAPRMLQASHRPCTTAGRFSAKVSAISQRLATSAANYSFARRIILGNAAPAR
jgi:hypothetical protein